MMELAIATPQLVLPERRQIIMPSSLLVPCPGVEELFPFLDKKTREFFGKVIRIKDAKDRLLAMSGSLANVSSKNLQDLLFGKTAYAGATTIYGALYTAAIDDTLVGNTANESAYTSYARLALTNNTTIFASGSGTTTYTKTFPSDATKSWATSTGGTSTCTFLGFLDGNLGTSADKGICWCSITSVTINSGDTPQLAQNAVTVVQD